MNFSNLYTLEAWKIVGYSDVLIVTALFAVMSIGIYIFARIVGRIIELIKKLLPAKNNKLTDSNRNQGLSYERNVFIVLICAILFLYFSSTADKSNPAPLHVFLGIISIYVVLTNSMFLLMAGFFGAFEGKWGVWGEIITVICWIFGGIYALSILFAPF